MKTTSQAYRYTESGSQGLAVARGTWDRVGAFASGLCLVHCLGLPAALLVLPGWTMFEPVQEMLHIALALALVPVTLFAVRHEPHCRASARFEALRKRLLWVGLALIWLALPSHIFFGAPAETGATVAGSACLIAGHSWRMCIATRSSAALSKADVVIAETTESVQHPLREQQK
jgi:hypothetical protein